VSVGKLPIILGVLVLLVVGLYLLATVVGGQGGLAGCAPSQDWRDQQRKKFRPPPVAKGDMRLQGCAYVGARVKLSGTCTITVPKFQPAGCAAVSPGSRRLTIDADSKLHFDFRPKGDDSVNMNGPLDPGKSAELTIPKEGAEVTISECQETKGCFVRFE
jgi:hypothetical protein